MHGITSMPTSADRLEERRMALLKERGYSAKAISLLRNEVNLGELPGSTIKSTGQSECGDILVLYLQLDQGIITRATFQYLGCAGLHAAAAGLTMMLQGKSPEEALALTPEALMAFLEGMPQNKRDCVDFCVEHCRQTISRYLSKQSHTGGPDAG